MIEPLADHDAVRIQVEDVRRLLDAAVLLQRLHCAADKGELGDMDLAWMIETDALIIGATTPDEHPGEKFAR